MHIYNPWYILQDPNSQLVSRAMTHRLKLEIGYGYENFDFKGEKR